ncbi:MAG: hypothetical protein KF787_01755 [Phycisphaeraceae bacterium]|nr:hypothetical protein [Phycisphaerae bacterium]MBX3391348.1 hypothetical protein [Phycisphaeraceae bacterium]
MNARINLFAAVLVACGAAVASADTRAAEALKSVVSAREEITPPRARAIHAAIDRTVGPAPAMTQDEQARLAENLRAYGADRLWRQADADPGTFRLAIDTFEWATRNAVNMPAPTPGHERLADEAIDLIVDQMPPLVDALYQAVPEAVRERIASEAAAQARSMRGMLCNRYYPELLRPAADHYSREELMAGILDQPMLVKADERWRPVAEIQRDSSLPEGSRAVHVGFFVERESQALGRAVQRLLRSWFVMPPDAASAYVEIPTEILDRYAEQRVQFEEQVKREQEERRANPDRLGEFIEKSGGSAPGGRPIPPKLDPR